MESTSTHRRGLVQDGSVVKKTCNRAAARQGWSAYLEGISLVEKKPNKLEMKGCESVPCQARPVALGGMLMMLDNL